MDTFSYPPVYRPRRSLLSLAVGDLETICSHLCPHCIRERTPNSLSTSGTWDSLDRMQLGSRVHTRTLSSLSLTCRLLHAVAEPYLFHCPITSTTHGPANLAQLITKLRPQLARHVVDVDIPFPLPPYLPPANVWRKSLVLPVPSELFTVIQQLELAQMAAHCVELRALLRDTPRLARAHICLPDRNFAVVLNLMIGKFRGRERDIPLPQLPLRELYISNIFGKDHILNKLVPLF